MLLCAALYLMLRQDAAGWLRLSLAASLCHEGGHVLLYLMLLHRMPHLDFTLTGICLHTAGDCLSRPQELALAAAGPLMNFALAFACTLHTQPAGSVLRLGFAWANLLIGGFNLLPVPPLDGWTMLRALRSRGD